MFKIKWIVSSIFSLCLCYSCYYDNGEDLYQHVQTEACVVAESRYSTDILPIMAMYCIGCHNNNDPQGNVNLEGYNNVKIYAEDGSLFGTSNHDAGFSIMPPSGQKIPTCDIEKMRLWIDNGALND